MHENCYEISEYEFYTLEKAVSLIHWGMEKQANVWWQNLAFHEDFAMNFTFEAIIMQSLNEQEILCSTYVEFKHLEIIILQL